MMAGIAVETIVESIRIMKTPMTMAQRALHACLSSPFPWVLFSCAVSRFFRARVLGSVDSPVGDPASAVAALLWRGGY
ncbi:MAG: hypothetical protein L0G46_07590 [Kocuria sp.]|nr:hypothetical protein [Kocuria sp.]